MDPTLTSLGTIRNRTPDAAGRDPGPDPRPCTPGSWTRPSMPPGRIQDPMPDPVSRGPAADPHNPVSRGPHSGFQNRRLSLPRSSGCVLGMSHHQHSAQSIWKSMAKLSPELWVRPRHVTSSTLRAVDFKTHATSPTYFLLPYFIDFLTGGQFPMMSQNNTC